MTTGNPLILGQDNTADHVTYLALIGGKLPRRPTRSGLRPATELACDPRRRQRHRTRCVCRFYRLRQVDNGLVLNQLPLWAPDAAIRKKILVDDPARLYAIG